MINAKKASVIQRSLSPELPKKRHYFEAVRSQKYERGPCYMTSLHKLCNSSHYTGSVSSNNCQFQMCLDIQCLLLKSFTWVEQFKISPTSTQKPYSAAKKLGKHLRVSLNRKLSLYVFTDPVYDAQRFKVC